MSPTPAPGQPLPAITVSQLGGGALDLGAPGQLVIVYLGQPCPKCKDYLGILEDLRAAFTDAGITTLAVSADSEEQAQASSTRLATSGSLATA